MGARVESAVPRLLLALDLSTSMRRYFDSTYQHWQDSLRRYLDEGWELQLYGFHRSVFPLSEEPVQQFDALPSQARLTRQIQRGTAILDAAMRLLQDAQQLRGPFRAIVLTDGCERDSLTPRRALRRMLRELRSDQFGIIGAVDRSAERELRRLAHRLQLSEDAVALFQHDGTRDSIHDSLRASWSHLSDLSRSHPPEFT